MALEQAVAFLDAEEEKAGSVLVSVSSFIRYEKDWLIDLFPGIHILFMKFHVSKNLILN